MNEYDWTCPYCGAKNTAVYDLDIADVWQNDGDAAERKTTCDFCNKKVWLYFEPVSVKFALGNVEKDDE